jgi:DNA-binding NarL/FixJ family response regulator
MCVNVFLADDANVMRNAIRRLLSNRKDIAVVGEASSFTETVQKTAELHPDLIILDVHLAERERIASTRVKDLLNGAKILAITLGADEVEEELLQSIGAARLLDKMYLFDQLIPAVLELGDVQSSQTAA